MVVGSFIYNIVFFKYNLCVCVVFNIKNILFLMVFYCIIFIKVLFKFLRWFKLFYLMSEYIENSYNF